MTQLGLQRTAPSRLAAPRMPRPRGDGRVALLFIAPVLLGFAVFYLYPTIRGLWWSFTDYSLLAEPEFVGLENYVAVLTPENLWVQLVNSTIAAVFTTSGVILLGVLAAFVIARYQFKGRDALFTLFTAGLLFPLTVAVVPLFTMIKGLGLLGNLWGIIIPQVAFALPTTIIILVPFLRAIPAELEDAATIDGAGRLGFFWRIVVPLAGPGLVTVGVLAFVASWNAYLLPLLILGDPSHSTLPLGTQAFATQYSSDTAKVMAFTTISMIPALVFFTLAQGRIVSGLTGAVKG